MDRFSLFEPLYRCSAADKSWSESAVTWAVDLLGRGTDTPSLRILAGLSVSSTEGEVREHFHATLAELGVEGMPDVEWRLGQIRVIAAAIVRRETSPVEGAATIHRKAVGPLNHPPVLQPWCDLDSGFRTLAGTSRVEMLEGPELDGAIVSFAGEFLAVEPAAQLSLLEADLRPTRP